MICRTCLRLSSSFRATTSQSRTFSTSLLCSSPTITPATQSPSTATQPAFSTPISNPPNYNGVYAKPKARPAVELPISIVAAGEALTGINYVKSKPDPIALEESEYPEWLWRVLEAKSVDEGADEGAGDEFAKSKKVRRAAAKRQRKLEARLEASGNLDVLTPKVPLTKQTIDLPANEGGGLAGALEAEEKRQELREAMRKERRKKIKGANFLKSM
ncbi:mitochondrial ribosomal protein L37-domain-containing protein [Calycina marina]|uniref:Large ribosomal subunit protein mL54 n=1 Tax=Calycina marina TaxID=1763456 RepID=A0A9P8CDX4_9HELO|nr:mitochondrial ribosomal protein L37-domain-containing protein [Calycina marina]